MAYFLVDRMASALVKYNAAKLHRPRGSVNYRDGCSLVPPHSSIRELSLVRQRSATIPELTNSPSGKRDRHAKNEERDENFSLDEKSL